MTDLAPTTTAKSAFGRPVSVAAWSGDDGVARLAFGVSSTGYARPQDVILGADAARTIGEALIAVAGKAVVKPRFAVGDRVHTIADAPRNPGRTGTVTGVTATPLDDEMGGGWYYVDLDDDGFRLDVWDRYVEAAPKPLPLKVGDRVTTGSGFSEGAIVAILASKLDDGSDCVVAFDGGILKGEAHPYDRSRLKRA